MTAGIIIGCLLAQISPEDSLKSLKATDGFEVSLWAHEPAVNNPTAMDIDSRGRVWIAEGLNYRLWKDGPLKRRAEADRIKVLEDTDGDGRADKVTVFAERIFPVPMGLAVREVWESGTYRGAKVYVGNSPNLLLLEDTDGDDVADKRSSFLTGFKGIDSDHGLHGMALGPDGRLYFTVGDARYGKNSIEGGAFTFDVTDMSGRRVRSNQYGTVLRVNLDGTGLEVLSYRQRNNYETCVDAFGHVFTSDNDDDGERGSRTLWLMDGANHGYKTPGATSLFAEEVPGIIPKIVGTGNGAPCGILVYEGTLFPEAYRGAIFQLDSGTRRVNVHPLRRFGAAYRSDTIVLLEGADSWFRPIDAAVAPDGSVLVCDWYDAGVGGNRFSDQTTGRIYRIAPKGSEPVALRHDFGWISGAIQGLRSPNVATRFAAREALLARGREARPALRALFEKGRPKDRARSLFLLAELPHTRRGDVEKALKDADPRIRELALRILARDARRFSLVAQEPPKPRALDVLYLILPLAGDPDAGVRRELLQALAAVETSKSGEALIELALGWDGRDRFYLEALRAALKNREPEFIGRVFSTMAGRALANGWTDGAVALPPFYPVTTNDSYPHVDDKIPAAHDASKVIGLAWVLERPEALAALRSILEKNTSEAVAAGADLALDRIVDPGATQLLVDRFLSVKEVARRRTILRRLGARKAVDKVARTAIEDKELRIDAIRAIARGEAAEFAPALLDLARSESEDDATRAAAIEALGTLRHEPARALAMTWVKKGTGPLAAAALTALSEFRGDDALGLLETIVRDTGKPLGFRRRAIQRMAARQPGARRLIELRKKKEIPEDLVTESTFLLHNHPNPSIRRSAREKIPLPRASGGKRIADLNEILALRGDAGRGRKVFFEAPTVACSRCHQVQGAGNWVGPDLSSIGAKYGKKELLYHILNPSGAISYAYAAYTLGLSDGRILSGLIADESADRVVLKTAQGERLSIPRGDIERKKQQTLSIMPDNLVQAMTKQDMADLLEFLSTLRRPVSSVGEYLLFGPVSPKDFDESTTKDPKKWRRVAAGRDGHLELAIPKGKSVFALVPVVSTANQEAAITLNTEGEAEVRLNGKRMDLSNPRKAGSITLREGANEILIRLSGSKGLITTLTSDKPLRFDFDRR